MYLSRNPTFRFWRNVYSFPALLPLFANVWFILFVAKPLKAALGTPGVELANWISISLAGLFMTGIVLANATAFWHARAGNAALRISTPQAAK